MLELMSGLLGAPNERIWPGMRGLRHADKYRLPPQPFNYLRKVGRGGLGGGELGGALRQAGRGMGCTSCTRRSRT
jgi:cyclin-dependent kinase 10